ncbi:hypothetical protein O1611_g422 [Lasiodiplodia mahajangana]|uniref:Uncharacterized protein n=1 Tax=Lasiodiplodia mahajangana TaxID=1108764 RepID=A0ACC2K089_9PEZI|nr:hypothetical protein O1611_g422 [Lasiodiplodia mahajangana]
MALTIDRLAPLNNDYLSASESSDGPELSQVERLKRAKELVYAYLRSLYDLGRDGRRIVRDDELRIAGWNDVRFRDVDRHAQDANNLEFWENKAQSLNDCFRKLHARLHPPATPRTVIAPGERTRRLVETWVSSVENPAPSRQFLDSPSPREHPAALPRIEADHLPLLPVSSTLGTVPDNHDRKRARRKRSYIDNNDTGSQRPGKRIHLLTDVEATRAASYDNSPVPLRRSARIAALPKKRVRVLDKEM